jgi:hypothetical protein
MAIFDQKNIEKFFTAVNFGQFLVIKTLDSEVDPELDPDQQLGKMLDPDPQ